MKTSTLFKFSLLKTFLAPLFLSLFFTVNVSGQEVLTRDGNKYLKVDLIGHSSFSSSIIVSDFHGIKDAKVIISDELGVIYIYPTPDKLAELTQRVKAILSRADSLDLVYTKSEKDVILDSITAQHGEWLAEYARTGVRETENDSCHVSMPFCTGTIYTFPAGVNTSAQHGPNYDCLGSQPNPAWYHLKIDTAGPIAIYMYSTPSRDIDFCLWGPFLDPISPCPMNNSNGGLTAAKVVDCSYSSAPTETANIPNGQTGQYYILIITNYSNQPCNVTFNQSSGTGTTDCTILPPAATTNSPVCIGGTIELEAANSTGASYAWTGPNNFFSALQNPTIPNAQLINAGVYSLTITVMGNTSDPTNTEVYVYDPPTATLSAVTNTNICAGDSVQLMISATSVGPYRAVVGTGGGIPGVMNFWQPTYTFWVKPSDTTTYTLTAISNNACFGTPYGVVTITVRPKPVPLFEADNLCASLVTSFTDQSTVTGGSISSWDWDFGDSGTSNQQDPDHTYATANDYNVTLSVTANNGCSKSATIPITVKPTPSANAGNNITIPYGTNTQLNGSSAGGSGSRTYQWQPSDKVDNATILNPNTVLLAATTDFTLTAIDTNGCQKSDVMTVTITGGPLSCLISPTPSEICVGENSTLNTMPTGGSGNYTYTWTSNPAGFVSSIEDPTVSPTVTTTYHVSVFDNFNTYEAQSTVTVNQKPVVNAGDDVAISHGTSTTLHSTVTGGASPYQYEWSPASLLATPTAANTLTHNLYGSQNFTLDVVDSKGCAQTDEMTVTIEGGPLQVNPQALNPVICRNESTTIQALPGGGSNNYVSYSWTSNIGGFTSTEAQPVVTPTQTTIYYVTVDDGFNTAQGSVTVTVNQLPVIDLIPVDPRVEVISPTEIGICVFDSITISADNPGAEYLWSNGSTDQTILLSTSGISFDQQSYHVVVTDPSSGCSNEANITANFTFENCSYGLEENFNDNRMKVYPNPSGNGMFNVMINELKGETELEVYNTYGKLIYSSAHKLISGTTFKEVLDLQNAPNGVYFLKLMNNEAIIITKLIIQ